MLNIQITSRIIIGFGRNTNTIFIVLFFIIMLAGWWVLNVYQRLGLFYAEWLGKFVYIYNFVANSF